MTHSCAARSSPGVSPACTSTRAEQCCGSGCMDPPVQAVAALAVQLDEERRSRSPGLGLGIQCILECGACSALQACLVVHPGRQLLVPVPLLRFQLPCQPLGELHQRQGLRGVARSQVVEVAQPTLKPCVPLDRAIRIGQRAQVEPVQQHGRRIGFLLDDREERRHARRRPWRNTRAAPLTGAGPVKLEERLLLAQRQGLDAIERRLEGGEEVGPALQGVGVATGLQRLVGLPYRRKVGLRKEARPALAHVGGPLALGSCEELALLDVAVHPRPATRRARAWAGPPRHCRQTGSRRHRTPRSVPPGA